MFSYESDASKAAIATLIERLNQWQFHMLDAQVTTRHLLSLGAKEMPRKLFLEKLRAALQFPTFRGVWNVESG